MELRLKLTDDNFVLIYLNIYISLVCLSVCLSTVRQQADKIFNTFVIFIFYLNNIQYNYNRFNELMQAVLYTHRRVWQTRTVR